MWFFNHHYSQLTNYSGICMCATKCTYSYLWLSSFGVCLWEVHCKKSLRKINSNIWVKKCIHSDTQTLSKNNSNFWVKQNAFTVTPKTWVKCNFYSLWVNYRFYAKQWVKLYSHFWVKQNAFTVTPKTWVKCNFYSLWVNYQFYAKQGVKFYSSFWVNQNPFSDT